MIRSMTAFARAEQPTPEGDIVWELRSVNHRYLEAAIRLNEDFKVLEPRVRERINARLGRGKLECILRIRWPEADTAALQLNEGRLDALLDACHKVARRSPEATSPGVLELLRWPGVAQEAEPDAGTLQARALEVLDRAVDELVETREREGGQIHDLLSARLESIEQQVARVRERLPEVQGAIREKLTARLAELGTQADGERLEQELVYLAQKMDVAEELDRIDAHVAETRHVLERDEPVGRRLDFLMQEFNREANTLASKSTEPETTRAAVELKVLIEQMREQVQNVE